MVYISAYIYPYAHKPQTMRIWLCMCISARFRSMQVTEFWLPVLEVRKLCFPCQFCKEINSADAWQPVSSHPLPLNFWMNWLILVKFDKRTWSQIHEVPTSFHENRQLSRRWRLTWVFPVRKILLCKLSNYLLCLTYPQVDHCVYISHTIHLHVIRKQSQVLCFSASPELGSRGALGDVLCNHPRS